MILLISAGCSASTEEVVSREERAFNAGLALVDFEYPSSENDSETITAAIWYPTEAKQNSYTYHGFQDYRSRVALDSPVADGAGPFPLVVFAHGGFGSGIDSAFFTEYLARNGYIVAAPDYVDTEPPQYEEQIAFSRIEGGNVGSTAQVLSAARRFVEDMGADRELFLSYLERHRLSHTSFVIDGMFDLNRETGSRFYGTIDDDAVGICGHSEGGLTALGKTGAHPGNAARDTRIEAALVFSAPAYPYEDTLPGVEVPLMLMVGDDDTPGLRPDLPRRLVYERSDAPKYYIVLKDATHFTFSNRVCGDTPLYLAPESIPQVSAVCRYGLAFFEEYLLHDPGAKEQLLRTDEAFAFYAIEERQGELIEWGEEPSPDEVSPGGIEREWR